MARNLIYFHYDGPIAERHEVTVRTLGQTLVHIQSAIDKAFMELNYGSVEKFGRLKTQDYPLTDFIVGRPRDGGYILDLINSGRLRIADRINAAVAEAFRRTASEAISFTESLVHQAEHRSGAVSAGAQRPTAIADFVSRIPSNVQRVRYADRAINREIDQVLTQIRADRYGGSTLELQFSGESANPVYSFNAANASKFHQVVAERTLGDPIALTITLRAMDGGNNSSGLTGKAIRKDNGKSFILHFKSEADFDSLVPFMRANNRQEITIVACPVLEYGVFDTDAGDMYFICRDD